MEQQSLTVEEFNPLLLTTEALFVWVAVAVYEIWARIKFCLKFVCENLLCVSALGMQ